MLIFSEVLTMKHTFKTLLGLVLVVLFLSGCSNPAGPETPEVNEPPVVETPEVNEPPVVELSEEFEVKFKWCTCYSKHIDDISTLGGFDNGFEIYAPLYLLDLHLENDTYVYGWPEGYETAQYVELMDNAELFREFSNATFEEVFGTKRYKKGEKIYLEKWTSEAINLIETNSEMTAYTRLYFLAEDVEKYADFKTKDPLKEIVVDKDIVIYIYWTQTYFEHE